jgi:hypothetical protein
MLEKSGRMTSAIIMVGCRFLPLTTLPAFKRPKCALARLARVWLKAKAHPFALLFLTSAKSINAHFLLRVSCAFESG